MRTTWQEEASARKVARERNRARNTTALLAAGVQFHVLDRGWHLRIEQNGERIDFMPGPGTWSIAGQRGTHHGNHRGAYSLIKHLRTKDQTNG